jgi:hypothetical protein
LPTHELVPIPGPFNRMECSRLFVVEYVDVINTFYFDVGSSSTVLQIKMWLRPWFPAGEDPPLILSGRTPEFEDLCYQSCRGIITAVAEYVTENRFYIDSRHGISEARMDMTLVMTS